MPSLAHLALVIFCLRLPPSAFAALSPYQQWGGEALSRIDADFWLPNRRLYALNAPADGAPSPPSAPRQPAMMWDNGVQLSALCAAARLQPLRYKERLRAFIDALDSYWTEANGIGGYDVQPGMKHNDRYYDDNVWIALAMAEAFEVTGDPRDLRRAENSFRFVMSGEDDKLGGGIYWHEPKRESKNTCANAPTVVAALRLHQLTKKPEYLAAARRLYNWTCANLESPEGLFYDNIKLDGSVDRLTYSYNTALMVRAASLFHALGNDPRWLAEAQRLARAAEAKWVNPDTHTIADGGRFAHLLLEGFLAVYERDRDPRWLKIVNDALSFVHDRTRDNAGRYRGRWDRPLAEGEVRTKPLQLLDQASVARAFWTAAWKAK